MLVGLTQLRFWAQEGPLRHPGSPHRCWGECRSSQLSRSAPRSFGCWAGGELKGVGGARGLPHLRGSPSHQEGLAEAWGAPCPRALLRPVAVPGPIWPFRCTPAGTGGFISGPVEPAWRVRGTEAGRREGAARAALPASCSPAVFPPRGVRTTAPTSSAGPPAPAPPGRPASGGTPRPHGHPSTAAAQVLGPSASSAPDEVAPLAFPLTNLSLVRKGSSGCRGVGLPGGDREPVHLPRLEGSPSAGRPCRGSRETCRSGKRACHTRRQH